MATVSLPVVPPLPRPSFADRALAPEPGLTVLCTAETAECTCPDFCERDHDND